MDTYARLLNTLAALVADGELTEEQAAGILVNWQQIAGLETILPLPTAAGVAEEEDDNGAAVLLILAAVLGSRAAGARRPADIYRRLAPRYRRPTVDAVQEHHAAEAARLADDLAAGRLTVAEWQAAARRLNQATIRTLAELGSPTGQIPGRLSEAIRQIQLEQAAYLQRFAEQIAITRLAAARPDLFPAGVRVLTMAQIAARLAMYSGPGRALYYGISEAEEGGAGWIAYYNAVDDDRTCRPCLDAEEGSPYLPGDGPMPGDVCLGGGNCRCWRELVYDPAEYARLTGQPMATRQPTP